MADYLTRVELHGAGAEDYQKLHSEMLARKFTKFIQSGDGTWYELPTAEYFSTSTTLAAEGVRDIAIAAVKTTGRTFWVITVAYGEAAWVLKKGK